MNDNFDTFNATVKGCIDMIEFEFYATGDGKRLIMSTGIHKLIHKTYWGPIQKTCPDLKPVDHKRESVPTSWGLSVTANPPASTNPKHRLLLRMVHAILLRALNEGTNFCSDKIIYQHTPELQIERNVLESPKYWELTPEISTPAASIFDRERKGEKRRHEEPCDEGEQSRAIVPFNLDMSSALDVVTPFLPPDLACDKQFVSYATFYTKVCRLNAENFVRFIEKERERRTVEERRTAEERRVSIRRIRERDVRREVEVVFDNDFDAPCGFDCGQQISADRFFVVRDADDFTLCCRKCCTSKGAQGLGTLKRIMSRLRFRAWTKCHGRNIRGHCMHCGPDSTKMHFLLTAWHAGHDIARSHGGSSDEGNLSPLHSRCNIDQGTETFDEYNRDSA